MKMKTPAFLIGAFLLMALGCKKEVDNSGVAPAPDTCAWKKLTLVKTQRQGELMITYNADGTIHNMGYDLVYFNGGQLMQVIGPTDTVVLDSIGRLKYMKLPFDGRRQTRYFFYDNQNRVIKTLTHTGNGIDYWAGLIYDHEDVVEMYYTIATPIPDSSHFRFTFYDTLCADQYLGMQEWGQIGMTRNRHLIKTTDFGGDSTHYAYMLDSNKRVLASYRNYDNSGWTYSRATDTTWYKYSCK